MQTGAMKHADEKQEPAVPSEKPSRSQQHVESVLARIVARHHAYERQSSFHDMDAESIDREWYRH